MKYFILLIFFNATFSAMEAPHQGYSRLELLPTDLKLIMIKHMIATAKSKKQARTAVYNFVIGDRNFLNNNAHDTLQTCIEDHLGWHWNNEATLPLAPQNPGSSLFALSKNSSQKISTQELMNFKDYFIIFRVQLEHKLPIDTTIIDGLDLHHRYNVMYWNTLRIDGRWTPLYAAVRYNNKAVAQQLLERGCDTQKFSDVGMNPLHLACDTEEQDESHVAMVRLLLDHKVGLNAQTEPEKKTALHLAVQKRNLIIYEMLKQAGADETLQDKFDRTARAYLGSNSLPLPVHGGYGYRSLDLIPYYP